jgi:hypothetical protein
MSWVSEKPRVAASLLAVAFAAMGGLALGVATTGDDADAEQAEQLAYEQAYAESFALIHTVARQRGLEEGAVRGRVAGEQAGTTEGFDLGGGVAGLRLIADQLAEAEAARATAEAELAERQANCGSIARAPDSCPTDAELAEFRAAVAAAKAEKEQEEKPDDNKPGNRPGDQDG